MKYKKEIFLTALALSCINAFAQPGSEIYLFDMKITNGQVLISNGKNITNHKGYDNQPFFDLRRPVIYYSSANDSNRTDIKYYNYETGETKNFTTTHEREYSPTVTPSEKKFISCILQRDNGAQDLVKYPETGGKPEVLVWHLKVGYHAWVSSNKVFLYVLDDSIRNSLHNYDVSNNKDTVIAENIGRSLHQIPWENALSYVQKLADKQNVIKRFDMATGISSPIIYTLPGQDLFCWVQLYTNKDQKKVLLSTDGSKVFSYSENTGIEFKDKKWQEVLIEGDRTMLKGVTRMATNADAGKLAVVVTQ